MRCTPYSDDDDAPDPPPGAPMTPTPAPLTCPYDDAEDTDANELP